MGRNLYPVQSWDPSAYAENLMGSVGPDRHEVRAPGPQETTSAQVREEG